MTRHDFTAVRKRIGLCSNEVNLSIVVSFAILVMLKCSTFSEHQSWTHKQGLNYHWTINAYRGRQPIPAATVVWVLSFCVTCVGHYMRSRLRARGNPGGATQV